MGQAKRRGSFEVRKQEAIVQAEKDRIAREEWERSHPRKQLNPKQAALLAYITASMEPYNKYFR